MGSSFVESRWLFYGKCEFVYSESEGQTILTLTPSTKLDSDQLREVEDFELDLVSAIGRETDFELTVRTVTLSTTPSGTCQTVITLSPKVSITNLSELVGERLDLFTRSKCESSVRQFLGFPKNDPPHNNELVEALTNDCARWLAGREIYLPTEHDVSEYLTKEANLFIDPKTHQCSDIELAVKLLAGAYRVLSSVDDDLADDYLDWLKKQPVADASDASLAEYLTEKQLNPNPLAKNALTWMAKIETAAVPERKVLLEDFIASQLERWRDAAGAMRGFALTDQQIGDLATQQPGTAEELRQIQHYRTEYDEIISAIIKNARYTCERPEKAVCPTCHVKAGIPIMHGYPSPDDMESILRMSKAGRIALGGCCITTDMPTHRCKNCHREFLAE